jgi:hypothetical protein
MMISMRRNLLMFTLAAVVAGLFPAIASAAVFSGAGLSPEHSSAVSAKAEFSITGNILTLVLTNTTAGGTGSQGDALTGVVFDLSKSPLPNLALASTQLTAGGNIYTNATTINNSTLLSGSWTDDLSAGVAPDFGTATTGFSGLFVGGSITQGNASPNYGIIAGTGTDGTGSIRSDFGGSRYPFILNSLTFTFTGASGLLDSQIENVKFLFGTAGGDLIPGHLPPPDDTNTGTAVPAPEPGSLIVFATLFAVVGGYGRFRRRTAA